MEPSSEETSDPQHLAYSYQIILEPQNTAAIHFTQLGEIFTPIGEEPITEMITRFTRAYTIVPFYKDVNHRPGLFVFELKPEYAEQASASIFLRRLLLEDAMQVIRYTYPCRVDFYPLSATYVWPNIT